MSKFRLVPNLLLGLILVLGACSESGTQEAVISEPEAPPEPIEGQKAFYQMYGAARAWAQDAEGLRLESVAIPEVENKDGLSGAWRATFVSPSKGRTVVMNYAVTQSSGKYMKGVFQDHEEGYSPGAAAKPWPAIALKSTSQTAYEVAMERKETKEYLAENPDTPYFFLVESTNRHPNLTWRVVWGTSVTTSGHSVYVDAVSGEFIEIMR